MPAISYSVPVRLSFYLNNVIKKRSLYFLIRIAHRRLAITPNILSVPKTLFCHKVLFILCTSETCNTQIVDNLFTEQNLTQTKSIRSSLCSGMHILTMRVSVATYWRCVEYCFRPKTQLLSNNGLTTRSHGQWTTPSNSKQLSNVERARSILNKLYSTDYKCCFSFAACRSLLSALFVIERTDIPMLWPLLLLVGDFLSFA